MAAEHTMRKKGHGRRKKGSNPKAQGLNEWLYSA